MCCERVTTTLGEETVTDGDVDVSVVCAGAVSESPQLLGEETVTDGDVDVSVVCAGAGAAV